VERRGVLHAVCIPITAASEAVIMPPQRALDLNTHNNVRVLHNNVRQSVT
jgi:hypothetical protein